MDTNGTEQTATIPEIEAFFIQEGSLIEGQVKGDIVYQHCPVCSRASEALTALGKMLEDSLLKLELERNANIDSLARMRRDMLWYLTAKNTIGSMMIAGHNPKDVMSQHPETAVSKTERRTIRSGKHIKQVRRAQRDARRRNR